MNGTITSGDLELGIWLGIIVGAGFLGLLL